LIIFTDHGFGPIKVRVNVNSLLTKLGFLKIKNINIRRKIIDRKIASEILNRLPIFSSIRKRLSTNLLRIFWRKLPEEGRKEDVLYLIEHGKIEWSKTIAISIGGRFIYLNSRPKFSQGIIGINKRESVRKKVVEELNRYFSRNKIRVRAMKFEKVFKLKENKKYYYPDIVLVEEDGIELTSNISSHVVEYPEKYGGHFISNGFFGYYLINLRKEVKFIGDLYDLFLSILFKNKT